MRRRLINALAMLAAVGMAAGAQARNINFFTQYPQLDTRSWYVSDGWANGNYQSCEWQGRNITATGNQGLQLTLQNNGVKVRPIGCAQVNTTALYGYGIYEARMQTVTGAGLNTAFFTYNGPSTGSPVWDEIDFEFLGKNPQTVQLNYFTNGKPQDGTVIQLGFDASKSEHIYSFDWEANYIRWYVDGRLVHQTPAGAKIPKTPGHIYLSLWSGAANENAWLGAFNYTTPVKARVDWVHYTPGATK
ncbi:MAG TPA: family 16 glycosylhydrolase [Rickettsiales bacterium]|nr:family 16 glycosylhydrolase [Rickettsiales bacterium]